MTLMALFAGTRVESLADLQRGLNALFGRIAFLTPLPVPSADFRESLTT
jgi:hypothetical protein